VEISKESAQAIVYAINYHLEDLGLNHIPQARALAIQVAADVKRIMLEESKNNWMKTLDAIHRSLPQHKEEGPWS
jgi:hypothetical protein